MYIALYLAPEDVGDATTLHSWGEYAPCHMVLWAPLASVLAIQHCIKSASDTIVAGLNGTFSSGSHGESDTLSVANSSEAFLTSAPADQPASLNQPKPVPVEVSTHGCSICRSMRDFSYIFSNLLCYHDPFSMVFGFPNQ